MTTDEALGRHGESADPPTGQAIVDPCAALDQGFLLPAESARADALSSEEDPAIVRQSFEIGGLGLLFPDDATREVMRPPPISRVPNTAPWMLGLANVRGTLVPVFDLAPLFGGEHKWAAGYLLVCGRGDESAGLLVDGLPKRQTLQPMHRLDTLPPLPDILNGSVAAAYDYDDKVWVDVGVKDFFEVLSEKLAQ